MKTKIIQKLQRKDLYCLQFDGKTLQKAEYQVVLQKYMKTEIKLNVFKCESGSAAAIHKELNQPIDEYDAWENICMITCDTTAENTSFLHGIVKLILGGVLSNILEQGLSEAITYWFSAPCTRPPFEACHEFSYSRPNEQTRGQLFLH